MGLEFPSTFLQKGSTSEDVQKLLVEEYPQEIRRPQVEYKNWSHDFQITSRQYAPQYSSLYFLRAATLSPFAEKSARLKWTDLQDKHYVDGIKSLRSGDECVVVGTVYKDMKLKPSILAEYLQEANLHTKLKSFSSTTDFLVLEDSTGRVQLAIAPNAVEPLPVSKVVTGVLMGVRGRQNDLGVFEATDFVLCGAPTVVLPISLPRATVALVSGLRVGHPSTDPLSLQLLRDFILGAAGSRDEQAVAASIVRVVIVGGLFGDATEDEEDCRRVEEADVFVAQLASSVSVDVMPGEGDPSNLSLPQNPLHPAFFKEARQYPSFQSVTNPYVFSLGGVKFCGCSGQAVDDVLAYSEIETPVEALRLTVQTRCIAPTAPDTLPCYPFTEADPFSFPEQGDKFPHVFFSGGHDEFAHCDAAPASSAPGSKCVIVPNFQKTPCVVLVDLPTLQPRPIRFGTSSDI